MCKSQPPSRLERLIKQRCAAAHRSLLAAFGKLAPPELRAASTVSDCTLSAAIKAVCNSPIFPRQRSYTILPRSVILSLLPNHFLKFHFPLCLKGVLATPQTLQNAPSSPATLQRAEPGPRRARLRTRNTSGCLHCL